MMAAPGTGLGQHRHVIAYASAYGQLSIDSGVSERSYISQVHQKRHSGEAARYCSAAGIGWLCLSNRSHFPIISYG
jgi:hypothetical protein